MKEGKPQEGAGVNLLIGELRRIADELSRLEQPPAPGAELAPIRVAAIIRARRLRDKLFPACFADPAWEMMLELLLARLEERRVSVSSLCIASAGPATTALRRMDTLSAAGLITRIASEGDRRRVYVELTDDAFLRFQALFAARHSAI